MVKMINDTPQPENRFKTRDLYEASVCYAMKLPLLQLERVGRQCWFIFDNYTECKRLTESYWRRDLIVNAKDYAEAIRSLKDRIFLEN